MVTTCEHDPVEQLRGEMGPGDYFDVLKTNMDRAINDRVPDDYHEYVEIDEGNRTDFRIICRKCHVTTGWHKMDAPGMPGVGVDWTRKIWAEISQHTAEEWAAVDRRNAVRPKVTKAGGK